MQLTHHTFSVFAQNNDSLTSAYSVRHADFSNFIAFDKRSGFRTHKVNENQLGLVETLSDKLKQTLFVVHRLDKETSGVILFAKNKETAASLGELFESHQIKKTYYFLTHKSSNKTDFKVTSHIEKIDKSFVNSPHKPDNSETEFQYIKQIDSDRFLWKAQPKTGKPHQIRLHAELMQIPILGDLEHGGMPYFRLALHASEVEFTLDQQNYKISSPLPYCFNHALTHLGHFVESEWQDLNRIYSANLNPAQTYRIYHRSNQQEQIKVDKYGAVIWVYWYKENPPSEEDLISFNNFCESQKFLGVVRHMINRGQGVGGKELQTLYYNKTYETQLAQWQAQEYKLKAELRLDQGFSPGLFLDQRCNRQYILNHSQNKTTLNLFSYTSLFSVACACGKAQKVTTVDASSAFLNWSKENFKLNDINPDQHEFFMQDSLLFLQGSIKRKRKWDIIICDPPSFGRTKTTTWKIEKNLPELIKLMWSCLNSNGKILFTCNYEQWSLGDIENQFKSALKGQKLSFSFLPLPDLDFEFLDAYDNLLKGIIIHKNK